MNSPYSENTSLRPSHEEIALRAHQLWLEHGCPMGHDVDNWLEAERQLTSDFANRTIEVIPSDVTTGGARSLDKIPRSEDVPLVGSDSPTAAMDARTKLAGKVQQQLTDPGRAESPRSKTSVEL